MKKNKTLLIVVILLSVVAFILIYTNKSSTIKKELKDFAVEDTASITKIFLADKSSVNANVTLEKVAPGNWKVNGKYTARYDAIATLLHTIKKLEVKSPVAKSAFETVIKNLATEGVKIEIYQKDELIKTYYVGGPTEDMLGTFMLLENSNTPFIMQLPGLNGYLTPRYFTDESAWKERTVFNYKQGEIVSVTVEYPQNTSFSFMLKVKGEKSFSITSPDNKNSVSTIDTNKILTYLAAFQNIQYEVVMKNIDKAKKDSILSSQPLCIMTVVDRNGNKNAIKFFLKPISENSLTKEDREGKPLKYDLDRMFALVDNGNDFVIVQHFVFDKLLMAFQDFIPQKTNSKD